jgi:hypothetical protein
LWTKPEADVPKRHFEGVFVDDLATVGRNWYSRSFAGYIDRHLAPALAERGLVRTEEHKRLGGLTSDGLAAAEELNEWLRVGRQLPRWVREKPENALAYAAAAGAAVLLMTEFYPELSLLSEHARLQGTPGAEFGDPAAFDVGALSLGSGAFDGIDSAFSALDAGVDAGASDFAAVWGAVVRNWGGNGGGGNGGGGNGGGGNGGGGNGG